MFKRTNERIINYHYDSLLSQINAEADFQTPKDDKQEDFIEIKGKIQQAAIQNHLEQTRRHK